MNMNKVLLATAAFALVSSAAPSYTQQATTKDQLIGSWKVLNLKATTGDKVAYPLGNRWRVTLPLPPRGFGYCSSMRREKHQPHRR